MPWFPGGGDGACGSAPRSTVYGTTRQRRRAFRNFRAPRFAPAWRLALTERERPKRNRCAEARKPDSRASFDRVFPRDPPCYVQSAPRPSTGRDRETPNRRRPRGVHTRSVERDRAFAPRTSRADGARVSTARALRAFRGTLAGLRPVGAERLHASCRPRCSCSSPAPRRGRRGSPRRPRSPSRVRLGRFRSRPPASLPNAARVSLGRAPVFPARGFRFVTLIQAPPRDLGEIRAPRARTLRLSFPSPFLTADRRVGFRTTRPQASTST